MNRRGCAALLLIAMLVGTYIWLWSRTIIIFPSANAETCRNITAVAVTAIVLFCLFQLSRPRSERAGNQYQVSLTGLSDGKFFAAIIILAIAGVAITWIVIDYNNIFPSGRGYQLRDISIWAISLFTLAALFRLFTRRSYRPRPPANQEVGMPPGGVPERSELNERSGNDQRLG